ncbi:nucleotidyl transferase AbiEii/AbiGii toxin family protein [Luteolibacter sp. GHJ8]|uniref:Nucleotidyl transferase AbiEii/AbiGii toxin family protein n=1 Tax=Luteolibacter rhizosphaerae TaxID=2989719 RepID=A0ABT3FYI2_9BACT|nr:nucleotidyl transferase AbiEii/AbiGii toxin family protein [Luteolibacter rhizosphaerae]MCW1912649.1 nucleotidyl transferase AbiEii/AbiGii toxin family protein [Luteolibacter rhizosphaerae]
MLALELVARLQQGGLEFIFKGGTSLALLFTPIRRLSIDVDILSLEPLDRLNNVLARVTQDRPPFLRAEHQDRRDREAPPTKHFKVYYSSALDPGGIHSIQLDVIAGESPYATTERRPVRASFFEVEEEVQVIMPTASSLLADKIACFAPSTIGYPYHPLVARTGAPADPRPMKVVKHLFDIGELATIADNLPETVATYARVHEEQVRFRGGDWSIDQTLDDTQDAAFWVSRVDLRPNEVHERIDFFRGGVSALDSHLFNHPFQRAESRLAAGRASLVAELIRRNSAGFDLRGFLAAETDNALVGPATLADPWANLNRLKQTDIKAFDCWNQAQLLRAPSE